MSRALKGEHLCLQHQGNHSHYAEENCVICKQEKRIAELERCCSQRGARMQIMFEYNKTVFHVIPAEWLAWFDADGVPVSKEIEK